MNLKELKENYNGLEVFTLLIGEKEKAKKIVKSITGSNLVLVNCEYFDTSNAFLSVTLNLMNDRYKHFLMTNHKSFKEYNKSEEIKLDRIEFVAYNVDDADKEVVNKLISLAQKARAAGIYGFYVAKKGDNLSKTLLANTVVVDLDK